jgi:hypothetical protein
VVPETPFVLEEKPDLFGIETIFGECSQAMVLEDNMWELPTTPLVQMPQWVQPRHCNIN